jgi:hypothetical protein
MTFDTLGIYALRLWLAGAMHVGLCLVQVGPFGLAGLGFVGWMAAQGVLRRQRTPREDEAPAFTLR